MAGTAWPSLVAGARAKASEVESKFDWVEGDFVPMLAGSKVDATYDLGQATFRWRDICYSRQIVSPNGAVGAPAVSWVNSPTSGDYRIGSNNIGRAMAGALVHEWKPTGEVLMPLQPAFLISAGGLQTTGSYTVGGQEYFDRGSDYSTPTFTAPVTGLYVFSAHVRFNINTVSSVVTAKLSTTARIYIGSEFIVADASIDTPHNINFSILIPMTAADTAQLVVTHSSAGVLSVNSVADPNNSTASYFCGYLFA